MIGQVFGQRYQVLGEIDQGPLGPVYRARQLETGVETALRLVRPELVAGPEVGVRLAWEIRRLSELAHPKLIPMLEAGELDGRVFVASEYVSGENLRRLIAVLDQLSVLQALRIAGGAARGLEYAHGRGQVHGSLDPDNIFLDQQGRARLADFGLKRALAASGVRLPAPEKPDPYLAPWCPGACGTVPGDDIYSLGAVLQEMLTGRPPGEETPDQLPLLLAAGRDRLDPELPRIVARCRAPEPDRRFPGTADLVKAIVVAGQRAVKEKDAAPAAPDPEIEAEPLPDRLTKTAEIGLKYFTDSTLLRQLAERKKREKGKP